MNLATRSSSICLSPSSSSSIPLFPTRSTRHSKPLLLLLFAGSGSSAQSFSFFDGETSINMGEGEMLEQRRSLAAPLIFFIVMVIQFATKRLQDLKKGASKTDKEIQLRGEIKQLLKEAASYSQPSTFAQAAKLRRSAAAKEKELANYQEQRSNEVKLSYDLYLKVLFILKVITHVVLVFWFWRSPIASVSQQLVQPFGKVLSWKTGGSINNDVMVGIIPWLVLCTRVSKFVCRHIWFIQHAIAKVDYDQEVGPGFQMHFGALMYPICMGKGNYPKPFDVVVLLSKVAFIKKGGLEAEGQVEPEARESFPRGEAPRSQLPPVKCESTQPSRNEYVRKKICFLVVFFLGVNCQSKGRLGWVGHFQKC
ncbi:hypothetical protein PTKIN_Ptkin07bG0312500 [Pterospermum kingtungense]